MGGWDTHSNNFAELERRLLPRYDRAISALISDLHDRGLDKDVTVVVWGDAGDIADPSDVGPAIARGGVVRLPVDLSKTADLVAVAGTIIAWDADRSR